MDADESSGASPKRVQVNVTFKQETLRSLQESFPSALDDSERVRRAVDESISLGDAREYSIRRG